jgi:lipoprotein-releasing system permease protein
MYKLLLSSRYLRTRFIALASIVSVMLGVATMIVVNSVMSGFATQMRDRIHSINADLMVESIDLDGVENARELMDQINEIAGEQIAAMTPAVEIYGLVSFEWAGQNYHRPATLFGILPEGKDLVSPLREFLLSRQALEQDGKIIAPPLRDPDEPLDWELTADAQLHREQYKEYQRIRAGTESNEAQPVVEPASGQEGPEPPASNPFANSPPPQTANNPWAAAPPAEPVDPNAPHPARCYIGIGLVSFPYTNEAGETETLMMVSPGEDITVSTVRAGRRPEVRGMPVTVVDVFKSGMSEHDSSIVLCNIEELQLVRGMLSEQDRGNWERGAITTIQIRLKDYADAPMVVERLQSGLSEEYQREVQIRTWEQKQGPLLEAVAVESAILNVLLFLIIAVAGFGILAIFYMIVVEKTRDIGILKALGASSRGVMSIFLTYGLSLGVVGSGVGVILGLLFVHYINEIEGILSWFTGHKVFDETIYYFKEIPTSVHPGMVFWVAFGAMLIAVLASVLPARRAARLHPVQALRYE